jgi:hypothetical protein
MLHQQQEIDDPMLYGLETKFDAPTVTPRRFNIPWTRSQQAQSLEMTARHVSGESPRQLGKVFGVSHEAIRNIVKRVTSDSEHST